MYSEEQLKQQLQSVVQKAIDTTQATQDVITMTDTNSEVKYKYKEDDILKDVLAYLSKTHTQHYSTDEEIECFDAWLALGDATPTFRNTALKYLWRYGKKNGNNKDDLLKALHYTVMCLYNDHYRENKGV